MIPDALLQYLRQKLGIKIQQTRPLSGGSINQAARVTLSDDATTYFLKWNHSADPEMFLKEEKGLNLLASAETPLRIPRVFETGATEEGTGFLIQEFVREGASQPHSAEHFGKALATLHQHRDQQFGLDHDNYIGRLPQSNCRHEEWLDFFIAERIEPQLRMATDASRIGSETVSHFESMFSQLPAIFPIEPPSLLHGDLWGGNYFYDQGGEATIFDPAVYYGHREMELAFTHLFGGFPSAFYRGYEAQYPLEAGFSERIPIYNLYPLLVHTNLFGGSYARQVEAMVQKF
ncbi:fructosamine kinase family protein [Fodinibius sediminis]|uniref:Fructosamine-3-kinase n=1 Tax=Fodinibius sediminis TaxID=1214077 RepID=A0A521AAX0_9BACT|nr:fructosamine kinase family protein [Fodinibius sediminis]SMO31963.1 Fructosamine-3-kinase [Fodinibius sediminis]